MKNKNKEHERDKLNYFQKNIFPNFYKRPLNLASSAFKMEPPAAPIIVLCERRVNLISKRLHFRILPIVTVNPPPINLSKRG
jgi:hypothetical protein